ncbi:uncharacterized protein TRIADDRAFT_25188 [Trichoplax adhaerens]|uniref:GST C-terminal domain-containing protein n=1 Tax=Trichoplax adhaerens TaxID=10228 RepID=B3RX24_TRIAD|nr:hypothetical protein TRIADDRAFT_25188 [Trichoplax adhaerens]EDV24796.1 hypothetical protein TRIADDRAFT_25188 [Trichoplax adhaerens]|eukprot:XP_002112686.1 hypothetical protein TRIADDRAFT_25188 [Trichoplax adhaerens]
MANDSKLSNDKGEFIRATSSFRNWVKADGSSPFPAEKNRYHLYVSLSCPWAHRTLITRKLKGLENIITVDIVDWLRTSAGWRFSPEKPGCTADTVNGKEYVEEIYKLADPLYTGRVTIPILYDKIAKTIVNNESSEIIRILNSEFNALCATSQQRDLDLYPQEVRQEINALNGWIYSQINNGVYRAGFATTQEAYDNAVDDVFDGLNKVEAILSKRRYLTGDQITEADIRIFPSLVRFDTVYVQHFKCNIRRIIDYPNIWGYLRDLYQIPEFGSTVHMEHIKKSYMMSMENINPNGVVAKGPEIDFNTYHGRDKLY